MRADGPPVFSVARGLRPTSRKSSIANWPNWPCSGRRTHRSNCGASSATGHSENHRIGGNPRRLRLQLTSRQRKRMIAAGISHSRRGAIQTCPFFVAPPPVAASADIDRFALISQNVSLSLHSRGL
jgi:hypothetical protein